MKLRNLPHIGLAAALALLAAAPAIAQQRPGSPPQQVQEAQRAQQPPIAQPQPAPQPAPAPYPPLPMLPPPETLPTVALADVLARVTRDSKKEFLVDTRVPQQIFLGGVRIEDVNYPVLLSILRSNGIAAATIEGRVNIVRDSEIRSLALPIVNNDDPKIPADEWVQRVITTTSADTAGLVPILRPMLPQAAHLAALPPRSLIMVDRYANVKRITDTVKALDRAQ